MCKNNSDFDVFYELLLREIEIIDGAIRQQDEITKGIKNWSIVTWTAALGLCVSSPAVQFLVPYTSIIPLTFWVVDAAHRNVQRSFIKRNRIIKAFVNSQEFYEHKNNSTRPSFEVLVVREKEGGGVSIVEAMAFRTVFLLYYFLAAGSFFAYLLLVY